MGIVVPISLKCLANKFVGKTKKEGRNSAE